MFTKSANDVTKVFFLLSCIAHKCTVAKVVNHSMVKFRYGHWSLSYCHRHSATRDTQSLHPIFNHSWIH